MNDADAAIHTLFEAHRFLREAGEKLAASAGQTHARRMVLQAAEEGATVPDIARQLGLQRQGIQRITDELVDERLGRYVDNPRHRLSKLFVLTDRGAAVLTAIRRAHAGWIEGIEAETPQIDWQKFTADLEELAQVLRRQASRSAPSR